jgi:hypothetical protein
VLLAMMALVVGALQRGVGSGGVDDPDVFGLWYQESLPLCMVITFLCSFPVYFDPGVVL